LAGGEYLAEDPKVIPPGAINLFDSSFEPGTDSMDSLIEKHTHASMWTIAHALEGLIKSGEDPLNPRKLTAQILNMKVCKSPGIYQHRLNNAAWHISKDLLPYGGFAGATVKSDRDGCSVGQRRQQAAGRCFYWQPKTRYRCCSHTW
jgi:hypothetical protein